MAQEIELARLQDPRRRGSRAWIDAYRKVVRSRGGVFRRLPAEDPAELASDGEARHPLEWMGYRAYRGRLKPLPDPDSFGARIRLARFRLGWTQRELAEAASVKRNNVTQIERGRQSVSLRTLRALAHALGVTMGSLLD